MFATQWLPNHTGNTEILLVELPLLEKFGNDRSLLVSTSKLGDIPRIFNDRNNKEERG